MMQIETPAGLAELEKQAAVEAYFEALGYQVIPTPKDEPSHLDCLILREGRLVAALEIRCRNLTIGDCEKYGSILLTMEKIKWMEAASKILSVPCFFVVALSDAHLAIANITDKAGRVVVATNERRTVTQATCNGGTVERLNSYINFSDFKIRHI